MSDEPVCSPRSLELDQVIDAARAAKEINPSNAPPVEAMAGIMPTELMQPLAIAMMTSKWWGVKGVDLGVSFLDTSRPELKQKILAHMNAWSKLANVRFRESNQGQVRIARQAGQGYWSYLGTDILQVRSGKPTMNLEAFSLSTPEREFIRVVRHETGHTLGCPHEHMRRELVNRIDPQKAYEYFGRIQGWSKQEVNSQVLTPLEERSVFGTIHADANSIMTYQIPGSITKDGQPILGGSDIDPYDYGLMGLVYPKE